MIFNKRSVFLWFNNNSYVFEEELEGQSEKN